MANGHGCVCCCFKLILLVLLVRSTKKLPSDDELINTASPELEITSYRYFSEDVQTCVTIGLTNCRCHVGSLSKVAGYYRARVGRYANSDSAILPMNRFPRCLAATIRSQSETWLLSWRLTQMICTIWQTNSMPPQKIFVLIIWISVTCVTKGKLGQLTEEKLKSIHAHYGGDMAIDLEEFKLEVNRWRYRWSIREPTDPLPQTLVETLDVANAAFYPGIYVAVKTLLTYPVSACAAERSFSSMKRLKTPLRNTMTDHRLSSLAILPTHKEREISGESYLDQFAQHKERRLALCL